jgi:hypothetical protein
MKTKVSSVFLFALLHNVASQSAGWYSDSPFSSDDFTLLSGSNTVDSVSRGGLWTNNRNWNSGNAWNLNDVWNQDNSGKTYSLLSNMSNWNTLPMTFYVTYNDLSNCSTWQSYKSMFNKSYSNQTEELMRLFVFYLNILNIIL